MIDATLEGDAGDVTEVLAGIPDALQDGARQVAEETGRRAPRLTGRLAGSFAVAPDSPTIISTAPYAGVIAGGWRARNIQPQRYIPTYEEIAQTMLDKAIESLGKKT